jgi:hypothetical protein
LGTITILTNFIACKKKLKQKTKMIMKTQMSKAFHHSKAQSKQIIGVIGLQLTPSMTIVFFCP